MKQSYLFAILITSMFFANSIFPLTADMVIFSYNRPLQLYALLESIETYVTGLHSVAIIYRASDEEYARGYNVVNGRFPTCTFIKQGNNPQQNFKPLTITASLASSCEYIIYAVDDIIVKDYIDISEMIEQLETHKAFAFFLRLGTNLDYCYMLRRNQPLPPLQQVAPEIYRWRIKDGCDDWGYPHNVDMTLYRKKDISNYILNLNYHNPNTFEGEWAARGNASQNKFGLCYQESKIVNLPLNLVNQSSNANMQWLTSHELLEKFHDELKINIKPLFKIANRSAHIDYIPQLIRR